MSSYQWEEMRDTPITGQHKLPGDLLAFSTPTVMIEAAYIKGSHIVLNLVSQGVSYIQYNFVAVES